MTDMRKHFESWALGQGWSVDRTDEGDYRTMTTDAAWGAWMACTQDTEERIKVLEDALSLAYGHLWLVNDEPGTPIRLHSSGTAASIARKILRDLMTAEQRESGINAARAALGDKT